MSRGHGPLVNAEWHSGWWSVWGDDAHPWHAVDTAVKWLDHIFALNASLSVYMAYGGTNLVPPGPCHMMATSYDWDAPINECGDMTYKYQAFLGVAKKYFTGIPVLPVKNLTKKAFGPLTFTQGISIEAALPFVGERTLKHSLPILFEAKAIEQFYGYLFCEASGSGNLEASVLDRGVLLQEGKITQTSVNEKNGIKATVSGKISILVEPLGWDEGQQMRAKGVLGATLDGKEVTEWTVTTLPLEEFKFSNIPWKSELPVHTPAFYRATFNVDSPADTFLKYRGLERGLAFVNGFHVGAYWNLGAQRTLFVRAPWLKAGENEVVIFESGDLSSVPTTVSLEGELDLGPNAAKESTH
jgi:beta-galactosidase